MHIRELAGKKVCILGYGREGKAMAAALEEYAKGCTITIADKNQEAKITKYESQLGENYLRNIDRFDVVIKSPGIPPRELSDLSPTLITTPTQIFFDSIKDSGAIVIGVTGSKGKSTTSSLIHAILKASLSSKKTPLPVGIHTSPLPAAAIRKSQPPDQSAVCEPLLRGGGESFLVGNIGDPAIAHLKDAKPNTIFVLEMSSYQLMDLTVSPHIAVVTAFFPEHLDYHGSLEAYLEAKKNITKFQKANDVVFFNADYPEAKKIADGSIGTKMPFTKKDAPVRLEDIQLKGEHNLGNIAAAWKVCEQLGIPKETAIEAINKFKGLPHRLESLGVHDDIEWVNDSISTTPESAIAALKALGNRVSVIILGGQDRGYDFGLLAKKIKESPTLRMAILLPDSGTVIGKALEHAGAAVILSNAETIEEAVHTARVTALDPKPDNGLIPIVLLSPAAPSYGHFKNFEERGEMFKQAVQG